MLSLIALLALLAAQLPAATPSLRLEVRSACAINALSGQVVFEQNAHQRIPPASLAKIVTLHLTLRALREGTVRLDDRALVSVRAWRTPGSRMFLEPGTRVRVEDLIKGLVVSSGNDAAVVLAEYLAGGEEAFVAQMNELARRWGLRDTRFANASGLPAPQQYTSAHDVAIICYHHLREFPQVLQYYSLRSFTYGGIRQRNRNGLLWKDPSVDGIKTGHLKGAGYHLALTAQRGGDRFIAVVMGARDESTREEEAYRLLNWCFRTFNTIKLFERAERLAWVRVWKGTKDEVPLVAAEPGLVTLRRGGPPARRRLVLPPRVFAPLRKGTVLGKVEIVQGKALLREIPLVAGEEVARAGWLKCLWHELVLLSMSFVAWLGQLF